MLHRLFARPTQDRPAERSYTFAQLGLSPWPDEMTGAPSVTELSQALRHAAVWACVSIKAKNIAALPVDVVRYSGRVRQPMPTPDVIARPSGVVTRRGWTHQLAGSMFTDGNAFGLVVDERQGKPTQIELVAASDVRNRRLENGRKTVTIGGTDHTAFPFGDLWHVAGEMLLPGSAFALSPIEYAGRSIGTALRAEDFGGGFFSRSGIPSALLRPEQDPGPDGAKVMKQAFVNAALGREPVVLPQTVGYDRISVDPEDSQFIDTMRFEVEQVCRFFGVPPSMVYGAVSGQSVTYANVSDADLAFLKHTLSYPIDLIEDALSDLLPAPRMVKFNRDAILRADTKARYEAHAVALDKKWRTVNEVRALEDEAPFDDPAYDLPGVPGDPDSDPDSPPSEPAEGGE